MPYCTTDELKAWIGKPFAWGVGNAPTDDEGEVIIASLQPDVDGYCRSRYTVPFDPVPDAIKKITLSLAAAQVVAIWLKAAEDNPLYERFRDKERDALKRLADIQAGKFSLMDADDAGTSVPGLPRASTPRDPFFTSADEG